MAKSRRPTRTKSATLMVRLDAESKRALIAAAELRRVSVSDYVRTVTVPQAEREVASARRRRLCSRLPNSWHSGKRSRLRPN